MSDLALVPPQPVLRRPLSSLSLSNHHIAQFGSEDINQFEFSLNCISSAQTVKETVGQEMSANSLGLVASSA